MMIEFPKTTDVCIFCGSKHIKIRGILNDGVKHYNCYDCHRYFSPTKKLKPHMTYPAEMYDMVIELSEDGLSSYKICAKLSKVYDYYPTPASIRRWVLNYKHNPVWATAYKKYLTKIQTLKGAVI